MTSVAGYKYIHAEGLQIRIGKILITPPDKGGFVTEFKVKMLDKMVDAGMLKCIDVTMSDKPDIAVDAQGNLEVKPLDVKPVTPEPIPEITEEVATEIQETESVGEEITTVSLDAFTDNDDADIEEEESKKINNTKVPLYDEDWLSELAYGKLLAVAKKHDIKARAKLKIMQALKDKELVR